MTFAGDSGETPSRALTLVDPANPTSPVQREAPGDWALIGTVPDSVANGGAGTAYHRYVVYAKGDRVWKLDLSKSSTPTPVLLSTQTVAGAGGVCEYSTRLYYALPAGNSVLVYASPGADAQCDTADDVSKAVKLIAAPTTAPTVIEGEVMEAIYDTSGDISGWVVKTFFAGSGGELRRLDSSFASPRTLRTLPQTATAADTYRSLGLAGGTLPGHMVYLDQRASTGPPANAVHYPRQIRAMNLSTGEDTGVLFSVDPFDEVVPIGSDAMHYYFAVNYGGPAADRKHREVRRFDAATPGPLSPQDYLVREPSGTPRISRGLLSDNRVYYVTDHSTSNNGTGTMLSIPKALGQGPRVDGRFSTTDYPLALATSGATLWLTAGSFSVGAPYTSASSDSGLEIFWSSYTAIAAFQQSLAPGAGAQSVTGILLGLNVSTTRRTTSNGGESHSLNWSGSKLLKFDGATGGLIANYGDVAREEYLTVWASMLKPDGPSLISALRSDAIDLYFINGNNPGMTRVPSPSASASAVPAARSPSTRTGDRTGARIGNAGPFRGVIEGDSSRL